MVAPDARIKPGRVFKSARNGTAIIVRNYMRRRQRTGGFQRFRYLVSLHTARNVNHLSRCGHFERSKINISVYNVVIYNGDQKDNLPRSGNASCELRIR